MGVDVILTPVAEDDFEQIVDYLFAEWGVEVANRFIDRFEKVCQLMSENYEIYPFVNRIKQIRKCVITKHNTAFFMEVNNAIYIVSIFDTRQNPDRLPI